MALSPRYPRNLTKEQLDRLDMLTPDVLKEQWKKIPEIVEQTSAANTSDGGGWVSSVADFFGTVGKNVGDAFSDFGFGIQETITTIVVAVIILFILYCLLRLLLARRRSHSRRTPASTQQKYQRFRNMSGGDTTVQ